MDDLLSRCPGARVCCPTPTHITFVYTFRCSIWRRRLPTGYCPTVSDCTFLWEGTPRNKSLRSFGPGRIPAVVARRKVQSLTSGLGCSPLDRRAFPRQSTCHDTCARRLSTFGRSPICGSRFVTQRCGDFDKSRGRLYLHAACSPHSDCGPRFTRKISASSAWIMWFLTARSLIPPSK